MKCLRDCVLSWNAMNASMPHVTSINAIKDWYQTEMKSGADICSSFGFWRQLQMENWSSSLDTNFCLWYLGMQMAMGSVLGELELDFGRVANSAFCHEALVSFLCGF